MLLRTLKYIANHPFNKGDRFGSVLRFFKWQIGSRLLNYPILYQFTANSQLLISRGETGSTGNLYCGLMEFYDMGFLLHFLREEDLFVDIGANIGVYSVLASAEVGAKTFAFEPVPQTFSKLRTNLLLNELDQKVKAKQMGVGSSSGKLYFTKNNDTTNHVVDPEKADKEEVVEVEVTTLDAEIAEQYPNLIKIDVEGFETEVLKGASNCLKNNSLKGIIIELNGSGEKFGYDESKIHEQLLDLGFKPFGYDPYNRKLKELESYGQFNTIYLRDLNFVQERLEQAKPVQVRNKKI